MALFSLTESMRKDPDKSLKFDLLTNATVVDDATDLYQRESKIIS
jgi:hypothetical protein